MKKEFYIGWQEKAPPGIAAFLKRVIPLIAVFLVVGAAVLAITQRKFTNSVFEFGQLTTLEGTVYTQPVPMIKIENPNQELGKAPYVSLPLIGFGKMGAQKAIAHLESQIDRPIEQYRTSLEGTLLYYDGKALLELSKDEGSVVGFERLPDQVSRITTLLGEITLRGEIIDPKCYFGVMKPGEGKVHRSCAIRCISGGIPPVLRVSNAEGHSQYFLLTGPQGEAINQEVLEYVARPVEISGQLEQVDDWFVLKFNPATDVNLYLL